MKHLNTRMQNMKYHTFFFIMAMACMVLMILLAIDGHKVPACCIAVIGIVYGLGATQCFDAYHRRIEEEKQELVDRFTKDYSPVDDK